MKKSYIVLFILSLIGLVLISFTGCATASKAIIHFPTLEIVAPDK